MKMHQREGLQVELAGWLGTDYVQSALCSKMPDAMRKDVEKSVEAAGSVRKQPERFTRKDQVLWAPVWMIHFNSAAFCVCLNKGWAKYRPIGRWRPVPLLCGPPRPEAVRSLPAHPLLRQRQLTFRR